MVFLCQRPGNLKQLLSVWIAVHSTCMLKCQHEINTSINISKANSRPRCFKFLSEVCTQVHLSVGCVLSTWHTHVHVHMHIVNL